jgi:hypothetical protein
MKPWNLDVATDYRLALLWLMDRLESARASEVTAAFGEEFGPIIPTEHLEKNNSGRIKWQHYVAWSRLDLVNAGLMGSGGRGVWTITALGKDWVRQNPAAGHEDLAAFIRQSSSTGGPTVPARDEQPGTGSPGMVETIMTAEGFGWRGKRYSITRQTLLAQARRVLRDGPPTEALRYKDWAVLVDGQPVSVKWLFTLATGADYNQFDSPTARRALIQIGIEPQRVEEVQGLPASSAQPSTRADKVKQRDEFLAQVASHLSTQLPAQASHGQIRPAPSRNYLIVVYAGLPRSHYELRLARGFDEVAFHLEGRRGDNMARLAVMAPHQEELTAALGHRVVAEPWGTNWARLAIDLPSAQWTDGQAEEYASLLARFIDATFPAVRQAFSAARTRLRVQAKSQPAATPPADSAAHAVLDRQLAQIRSFLQGRASRPSDEALCDWVQFCYTFELFAEGAELFNLVVPSAVNDWLYGRTRRLAQVCRMRAQSRG